MKLKLKLKLNFVLFLLFGLISGAHAGEGHVGEIRYSILSTAQFQGIYGSEWEIMKGQDIPVHSDLLPLWGQAKVPDARGLFLQSSTAGRDAEAGNPDGELAVGWYQAGHPAQQAVPTNSSGKIIIPEGGKETRPSSIIVNTFIKLRESAVDPQKNEVTPRLKASIIRSPEFKEAVETILQNMMNRSY